MAAFSHALEIRCPVSEAFDYMLDLSREHEWQPQLRSATQSPPGPPAVGAVRTYTSDFMGKRVENRYVIREFEPNRRLVLESLEGSAVQATTTFEWEALSPDRTRVRMVVDGKATGVLRFVPDKLLAAAFEREVRAALEWLEERLSR